MLLVLNFAFVACAGLLWLHLCRLIAYFLWRPMMIEKVMSSQGIVGPPQPTFPKRFEQADMTDINHDILRHILPEYARRFELYGQVNMHWQTSEPRINTIKPELTKKVLIRKFQDFGKPPAVALGSDDIFKHSVFDANGDDWLKKRRVLSVTFQPEKIKDMVETMLTCTQVLVDKWKRKFDSGDIKDIVEVDVYSEFRELTTSIIARAVFNLTDLTGLKDSGRIVEIIGLLVFLQTSQLRYSWLPFVRMIPTRINLQRWRLRRELNHLVYKQIETRRASGERKNDLLDLLIQNHDNLSDKVLIDQCKTVYTNGHGTLSALYSWCMMLLAVHPEWQERARDEVLTIMKDGDLTCARVNKLKLVDMIIRETLRLYSPMPLIPRMALKDCTVGDVFIPKGLAITLFPIAIHHDYDLWGEDAHEFNPYRFTNGSAAASNHPMGFMPFSFGSRACVGQPYAQMQAKLVLATLLQHFRWSLSPNYRHNPYLAGTLFPKHGMPILLRKL